MFDASAAEKAARFIDLCDAYDVQMIFLCENAGPHGRSRHRAHGPRPSQRPTPDQTDPRHDAVHDRGPAQSVRPRILRDGIAPARARPASRLAHGRVRRHGPRGRGEHHLPPRARSDRGYGGARRVPPREDGHAQAREHGAERRGPLRRLTTRSWKTGRWGPTSTANASGWWAIRMVATPRWPSPAPNPVPAQTPRIAASIPTTPSSAATVVLPLGTLPARSAPSPNSAIRGYGPSC